MRTTGAENIFVPDFEVIALWDFFNNFIDIRYKTSFI